MVNIKFLSLFLTTISIVNAFTEQKSVLVLLENNGLVETHSAFFEILSNQGFSISYKVADDPSIVIKKYGAFLYDNLILFAPTVEEFGGSLTADSILEFIDHGGNVFIAGSSDSGDLLREIASECGFELDSEGTSVIDHFNYVEYGDNGYHTLLKTTKDHLIDVPSLIPSRSSMHPILYRGTGLLVDRSNSLVIEILSASSTAYSHDPKKPVVEYPHATGTNVVLVAGLQARNNARVVFAGSLEMFSDKFMSAYFGKEPSGNIQLTEALTSWCFKQRGVIRVTKVNHHLVGEKLPPLKPYTISDEVVYSIGIEKLEADGSWVPYIADDIQMEFVRIDPFVRINLVGDKNGIFKGRFKIPDVYGVYQFKVEYRRIGMSNILNITQFSVRPLRHDQYERFIASAFPYYVSAFSMMAGVSVFAFIFLHFKEDSLQKTKLE